MPIVVDVPNGAAKKSCRVNDESGGPNVMNSEFVVVMYVTYVLGPPAKQSLPLELVMATDEYAVHDPTSHGTEGSKTNDPVRVPRH